MSYIVAEGLTKKYGNGDAAVIAADDISFQIEEGAFIGIMGESGSGKSTLLGMMGAMNAPTFGRFIVDDIDIYSLGQEQRVYFPKLSSRLLFDGYRKYHAAVGRHEGRQKS
jgi:putative ABC transport system ATP-binding protein